MGYEYDANNAYLVVTRNDQDICMDGMTTNECNVGGGIDEEDDNDVTDEIISQPDKESAKDALNQLSGEIHASAKAAMLEDSRFLREAVNNRLRDPAVGNGACGHIYTSWGTFDSSENAAQMKRDIAGVILGVDKSLNETWTLGIAGDTARQIFACLTATLQRIATTITPAPILKVSGVTSICILA